MGSRRRNRRKIAETPTLLLGTLFALGVWYKYAYDLREAAGGIAETAKRVEQVRQVLPGLALGFFEVTVLAAISRTANLGTSGVIHSRSKRRLQSSCQQAQTSARLAFCELL